MALLSALFGDFAGLALALVARDLLDLTHVQAARHDFIGELVGVGLADQHARMTGAQLAGGDVALHRLRQFQKSQRVGDVTATLADDLRDIVLAVIERVDQRLIAGGFFERIQVGALHVLDDRKLERLRVGRFDDDDRHLVQAGALRGTPAPLAGDDFEFVLADIAHDDRLDDAALPDGCGQLFELGFGEMLARVARIGAEIFDGRAPRLAARLVAFPSLRLFADIAHQRGEASSQTRSLIRHRRTQTPIH